MIEPALTLWDSTSDPAGQAGTVYRWRGYAENGSVRSLLRYVELHGERLRRRYLEWVHDLGEHRIRGRRLIDRLAFADGSSYWWMTLFVEQSPWKTPSIIDAIRLFALEDIVAESRPRALRLVSANRRLDEVLRGFCQRLQIAYEWRRIPAPARQWNLVSLYRALPFTVQALISFTRHLRGRWPLRRAPTKGWSAGDRSFFFCSYFTHLDRADSEEGKFHSRQWEDLPALLQREAYTTNWLQHYLPSSSVPNVGIALDRIQRFSRDREEQGFHTFVESYLSWRVALCAFMRWTRLVVRSWRLGAVRQAFRPKGSDLSLWPLMRADWRSSLRGPVAISNLLWIELFEEALRELPPQSKGLYLYENQAWERALIERWRRHQHGPLIAVAHSTVRFWDLRYYADPRTVRSVDSNAKPQPDIMVLNGPAAVRAFLEADYPKESIVECESLRYSYLHGLTAAGDGHKATGGPLRLLILGDYLSTDTTKMLRMLEAASQHMMVRVAYTLKPHPHFAVSAEDYPALQLNVVTDRLETILKSYDVAYAGNATSAAVDAYLSGLPVIVMVDEAELNFSPLRGHDGVRFVGTPEELAAALDSSREEAAVVPDPTEFFCLDPELPRWRGVLEIADRSRGN